MVTIMPPQPHSWGAIPVLLHGLLRALRSRHEITLVTLVGDEGERQAVDDLRRSGLEIHAVERTPGTGLRRMRMAASWLCGRHPKRTIWNYEPRLQHTLNTILATRRFDLIQVEDLALGAYTYPRSTPKVLTHYEVMRPRAVNWHAWREPRPLRSIVDEVDWHRWPRHQADVCRRFDCIQVFSQRDARSIEGIAPDIAPRVRVNPFCVEMPRAADPARERPGSLLFVGSFLHPPNVDAVNWLVDDILPRVRAEYPDATLTIAGSDPRGRIRHLAGSHVALAGYVEDLTPLLDEAAVLIAPVRIGGGQRMKVLYGLGAGKAVVTTARGAEGLDAAASVSALRVAEDADGIARATVELLRSPTERRALACRARALVQDHYTPEAYACRAQAVYEELRCPA
jgi:glycosyltransferase involved in cell wall biosynthesis